MLTQRVTGCSECTDITTLIAEIDCKLSKLAGSLYNNLVFMLNRPVSGTLLFDLLTYKRILQYKQVNSDYAGAAYTIEKIASKVKLLKYKQ